MQNNNVIYFDSFGVERIPKDIKATATGLEPRTTWFVNEHSTIWPNRPVWPNGSVFVYELSVSGFEASCSHLNFRFHASFEQGVPWHSGNYRVWINSETRTWHEKNIQLEIKAFINYKNIKTNIFRIQAYNSIMCGYFYIGFIDFMVAGKTLTGYKNLFSPNNFFQEKWWYNFKLFYEQYL